MGGGGSQANRTVKKIEVFVYICVYFKMLIKFFCKKKSGEGVRSIIHEYGFKKISSENYGWPLTVLHSFVFNG